MRIWQKLTAIALSFTIPLAVTAYFLLDEKRIKIDLAENELRGNEYLRPLSQLLVGVSRHRTLSRRHLGGNAAVQEQLSENEARVDADFLQLVQRDGELRRALKTTRADLAERGRLAALPANLQADWGNVKARGPDLEASEAAHERLLGNIRSLIDHVGDTSELVLDPDIETYYTMEALLRREPELIDRLSQLGDSVEQTLAAGVQSQVPAVVVELVALIGAQSRRLESGLATAFADANQHPRGRQLESTAGPLLRRAIEAVNAVVAMMSRDILEPTRPGNDTAAYVTTIERAIDANARLWAVLLDEEEALLRTRLDGDLRRRWVALGAVLAALAFSVLLTLVLARRISRNVVAVAVAAEELAAGDLTRRADVRSRDEVGAMAAGFNSMAERLQGRVEAERLILETANDAYISMGQDGRITEWNRQAELVFGWSRQEALGAPLAETIIPGRYREDHHRGLTNFLATGAGPVLFQRIEVTALRRNGDEFPVELTIWPTSTARGPLFNAFLRDVTERKEAERIDRRKTAFLKLLETVAVAANEAADLDAALTTCVDQVCARVGWPVGHVYLASPDRTEMIPTDIWHLAEPHRFEEFRKATEQTTLASGVGLPGRVLAMGQPAWVVDVTQDVNFPRAGKAQEVGLGAALAFPVVVGRDVVAVLEFFASEAREPDAPLLEVMANIGTQLGRVVERVRAQETLTHQAMHDALTGLPNRNLFVDRLTRALARLEREPSLVAVLFLDLDGFKLINDSLGHDAGDEFLIAVGDRLRRVVRPSDTVARFGGDEFTILCDRLTDETDAVGVAQRITAALLTPFSHPPREDITITTSIGIAFARGPVDGPERLIRDADAAMYRAKEQGRARFEIFDIAMHRRVADRLETQNALRRAVARGELRLHYQPQVSLADGRITGVEALVRWEHPERGLLSPVHFIPLAEESQLIVEIGSWVIEEACRQAARWRSARPDDAALRMCVNVSARQLAQSELVDVVRRATEEAGIEATSLCLEITESALIGDADFHLESMLGLKFLGVSLGVDDFGTGYSSLSYLKRFPVDVLKIDKSFIDGLGREKGAADIVATVISLAHALGLKAIAEGVETADQAAELARLGCDEAQGYHYARPGLPEELTGLLHAPAGRRN